MIERIIKIVFNRIVAPDTFLMGFRSPEIASESRPGQFVMVRVGATKDPLLRRPFSVCGVMEGDLICILYRVVGHGTKIMSQKEEGEILSVIGPLGRGFELPEGDKKVMLVSGGIGVAPLFYLAQAMKTGDVEFMAGFNSSREIIDANQISNLQLNISLATDDGTTGYAGTVTDLLTNYLDQNHVKNGSFYLYACGPLPMLKSVVSIAYDRDITCQVSMEASMACGLGACQGCAVKAYALEGQTHYHQVCKDGPVFPANVLDWNSI